MRNVVTISLPNRLLKKLVRESIDEIGKVDGRGLDAIIGAVTMEQWEILLNPKDKTVDLTGLKRREFTEFLDDVKDTKTAQNDLVI